EKAKEVAELKLDKQKKKLQIEELERTVRLKVAEADVFQLKAKEAKREAERLQRIALAKIDKSKEEYASSYLKLRLSETEAEKQYLFEKIKPQKSSRASQTSGSGDPAQILGYSKIHDLLHSYNVSSKLLWVRDIFDSSSSTGKRNMDLEAKQFDLLLILLNQTTMKSGVEADPAYEAGGEALEEFAQQGTANPCCSKVRSGEEELRKKAKDVVQENVKPMGVVFSPNASSHEEYFQSTIMETRRGYLMKIEQRCIMEFTFVDQNELLGCIFGSQADKLFKGITF
ncbi:hypothetical protein Tsubulata_047335, partial [Turnera subulata]